jgi:GPN-loop GTPase
MTTASASTTTIPRNRQQLPIYGQVVVGPPGSGKTTFCEGMQQYLKLLGRDVSVINLDPANEGKSIGMNGLNDTTTSSSPVAENKFNSHSDDEDCKSNTETNSNKFLPYEALYDVCEEVVNLTSVMSKLGLGPNGGLVYCMEYMEINIDSIIDTIEQRLLAQQRLKTNVDDQFNQPFYLLFDLPGQVELYTHSNCVHNILQRICKVLDLRLTAVQLIDSFYCVDAAKFISAALLGTTTMIRLELPTINVLSKIDLLASYGVGELPFQIDYYTNCLDLDRLLPFVHNEAPQKQQYPQAQNNSITDMDGYDYADDPEYQEIRKKRKNSKLFKKISKLHQVMGTQKRFLRTLLMMPSLIFCFPSFSFPVMKLRILKLHYGVLRWWLS